MRFPYSAGERATTEPPRSASRAFILGCLTLAKWETVSGRFGGYLTYRAMLLEFAKEWLIDAQKSIDEIDTAE
jgi:hypothetical protein